MYQRSVAITDRAVQSEFIERQLWSASAARVQ